MASKLLLTREGSILNRRQQYKVLVDGVEVTKIKNGDTEEIVLPGGTHTIQCKINWMSSREKTFEMKEGINTYLKVRNGARFIAPLYFLMLAGLLLPFFIKIAKFPLPEYAATLKLAMILPAIIYMAIYMTLLRKNYLVIAEDNSNPFK